MAITTGSRIGPYKVTSQLGEGGMGVVYRAHDTKLLRNVAIKVLPDHLASDPDRLSRLQREAQLLASLNHPNIAHIYGLEEVGGTACIVMELVEGDTLSDRLQKGPLSVDEAVAVAKQIAEGLAAAHERGVIHRDLKPANIKLTPDGTVKILDFGLAKASQRSTQATQMSAMPTKVSGSIEGLVVGTAAYMSPEQARGKEVDARTDIWAFGCVFYEMLTGKLAFEGETFTDIVARVVTASPDLNLLPATVPAPLRLLLEVTLNKNQAQRLQHIADVRLFLDEKLFPSAMAAPVAAPAGKQSRVGLVLNVVLLALLIGALLPAMLYFRTPPPAAQPQMRFEVVLPPDQTGPFAVSPNGQYLAYMSSENRAIWVRSFSSEAGQKLGGTENAIQGPLWSPDSRYVVFLSGGKIKKIEVATGALQTICDLKGRFLGFTWSRDGVILIAMDSVIVRTSEAGGEPKPQVTLNKDRKEQLAALPTFLPDGNHFFYAVQSSLPENSGIFLGSLDSNSPKRLMPLGARLQGIAYAPQGYLIVAGENLIAQRFDIKRLELGGAPIQLAEAVDNFSVSDTGLLLLHKGSGAGQNQQLTWFTRAGEMGAKVGAAGIYGDVEVAPKGDRVAVDIIQADGGGRDVWVIDVARNVASRITLNNNNWSPSWSPDGSQLIFSSSRDPLNHIYRKSSSGAGSDELISPADKYQIPVNWSSDGRYIVYSTITAGKNKVDTWVMENFGAKNLKPFVESEFDKAQARISPDSHFLAYATNDSGIYQVVVQTFPDPTGGKWQITADGGIEPKWRRDGHELYYLGLDGKMMAVQVKPDHTFGTPSVLFQTPLPVGRNVATPRYRRYDVAPDGRFLIAAPTGNPAVVAIVNWTSGLGGK